MRTANLIAAGIWLLLGLAVVYSGYDLGLGVLVEPGPGFMLFWLGGMIAGFSLIVLVSTLRRPASPDDPSFSDGQKWFGIIVVSLLLLLYAWLLPVLGFPLLTLLFLLVLFRAIEPIRWPYALTGAVLITGGNYLVFNHWLGAQLPTGAFIEWATQWTF